MHVIICTIPNLKIISRYNHNYGIIVIIITIYIHVCDWICENVHSTHKYLQTFRNTLEISLYLDNAWNCWYAFLHESTATHDSSVD